MLLSGGTTSDEHSNPRMEDETSEEYVNLVDTDDEVDEVVPAPSVSSPPLFSLEHFEYPNEPIEEVPNQPFAEDPKSIVLRIGDLKEDQIGQYKCFERPFHHLTGAMKKIRETGHRYDSDEPDKITAIIESGELEDIYDCFRGIYEFIIHLHNVYDVKLKPETPDDEDTLLRAVMETCFRK